MVTHAILIQWGTPIPGRERMALEEFNSYTQWANKLKKDGKIERVEVYQLESANFQQMSGFTVMEGTEQQIRTVVEGDDLRSRIQRVMNMTQNVRLERCVVGTEVGTRMQGYAAVLQQLRL
jgi:hypothetical protein